MDGIKTMHPQDFILPGAVRMYFSGILGFFGIISDFQNAQPGISIQG